MTALFIDTEAFERQGFRFDGNTLEKIGRISKSGIAQVVITDIIDREIRAHMQRKVEADINAILPLLKEGRPLHGTTTKKQIDLALQAARAEYLESYEAFLEDSEINIIKTSGCSIGVILDDYFNLRPPFEEKKKHEFPDAISLNAFESWISSANENPIVISHDKGVESWSKTKSGYIFYETIEEAIKHLYDGEEIYQRANNLMLENVDTIWDAIMKIHDTQYNQSNDSDFDIDEMSDQPIDFMPLDITITEIGESSLQARVLYEFKSEVLVKGYPQHYAYTPHMYGPVEIEGRMTSIGAVDVDVNFDFKSKSISIEDINHAIKHENKLRLFDIYSQF